MASVLDGVRGVQWQLVRLDQPDAPSEEQASALLRCHSRTSDGNRIGRMFSSAAVEMALASYPGFTLTSPPGRRDPLRVYRPVFVDAGVVTHTVTRPDGSQVRIAATLAGQAPQAPGPQAPGSQAPAPPTPPSRRGPWLPTPRRPPPSGCPWAYSPAPAPGTRAGWPISASGRAPRSPTPGSSATSPPTVSSSCCRKPRGLSVRRYELPNLRALNFTLDGLLARGSPPRPVRPQAKALGEWLRSRLVDVPAALVPPS